MANLYNLKRFDLNLLIIFECIYQNLSISQAAQTLFITPSAVSQSLQRLRTQLNDPLFVRSGKGITPTNVAINLHHHLAGNLDSLEQTINMMSNSELNKRFVVYGPQFYADNKIMDFMNLLFDMPNLEIEYYDTASTTESIEDLMQYRRADVVFTSQEINNRALVCEHVLDAPTTIVCRKNHPRMGANVAINEIGNETFTQYQTRENEIKKFQNDLAWKYISDRKIAFRSPSLITVLNAIRHSDLLGIVPKKTFDLLADSFCLKEIHYPIALPPIPVFMVYSRAMMNSKSFAEVINSFK